MTVDAWLTLGLIVVLLGLLIWDRFPTWSVFAGALLVILTLGLAPESQALSGFSNSGVLSVVVLFVVAEGMYRTGAIGMIIDRVVGLPSSERAANLRIMPITAAGSAIINNTPIVAMLVPVVADLGRSAKLAVSKLYMGVSNASILGGAATLIGTSSNLIIAGLVFTTFGVNLDVLFPTAVGLPAAIVGVVLMLMLADRLLGRSTADAAEAASPKPRFRTEFVVASGRSPLPGRTLARAGLAQPTGARLLGVRRGDGTIADPPDDWALAPGDVLAYDATISAVGQLWSSPGLVAANPPSVQGDEYATRLLEGVVAVDSPYIGQPASELAIIGRKVVAVSRSQLALAGPLDEMSVAAGDSIVLEVGAEQVEDRPDGLALTRKVAGYRVQRTDRAVAAMIIVGAMVLLNALGVMSLVNAALLASAALIATGCLSFRGAINAIDWETYVILACAVGLEPAVTNSGLADVIADILSRLAGGSAVLGLVVVFIGTVTLTNLVTNSAAAALMFPITIGIAASLGAPWEPFVVVQMLACSYAFINPAGYQTHLMVMKPGGYTFGDFAKVGMVLTVVLGVVVVGLTTVVYGVAG
jgi:di/tricarboxylate transporter